MTDHSRILEVLRSVVADVRPQLKSQVIDTSAPLMESGLGLDSIDIIQLITQLENTLDLQFDESVLVLSNFSSLDRLARVIETQLPASR